MFIFDLKVTLLSDPWCLDKATVLISYVFLTITQVLALEVSLSIFLPYSYVHVFKYFIINLCQIFLADQYFF